jgi:hypothetical protein
MKANSYFTTILVLLWCCLAKQGFADNPHEISKQNKSTDCVSCHIKQPQYADDELLETKNHKVDLAVFKSDGIEMCSGCHNPDDGHKVGLKLDFEVPADMPLGARNKLICLTCHYTHGNLTSKRPQASASFLDRILDQERLHKSFLLRRNNAEGELCLTCHNVNKGSK